MNHFTLQKYRDLGDIVTDTFAYIRVHYKSLGKALLLLVLPFFLVSGMLVGEAYSGIFTAIMDNPDATPESIESSGFWIGMLMLALSSGALLTITLTHIKLSQSHDEIEISMLLERFGNHFLTLFLLYIIIIIAVFFSFFLFIIPGIYVGVKLFISPAVAVIEDRNPLDAISRSWSLVQGHWWFTLGVYLVMNIITSFMSYVLIIPATIIMGFISSSGADTSQVFGTGMGIMYGLMIVVASLFSVLMLIAMCLQYFNLIERKEGAGLRSKIEELG